jgi:hypothetical protein
MPKGVASDALANSGKANAESSGLFTNAGNIYGSLAPTLAAQAAAPAGYTPTQKAAMDTAGLQTAGGTQAAAVGQGALLASRTKNAGTADAAIAQSARTAGQQASNTAVGTEVKNANLQQQQRQSALQGEQNLYSTTLGGGMNALGLSNQSLGVADQADANNPWMKLLQSGLGAGGQAAGAYFGAKAGGGAGAGGGGGG